MSSSRITLFSSNSRSQTKNLVEFKAGKMTQKNKMVHPDKRKGTLYIYQSEDSLMHFCWKDRHNGNVEDDLIIFPDDCEYKRVPQCTTGRVYVLKFKSSNRRFFFWMQEAKSDKDEEYCKRINEVLNNPPTPGSQRNGGATPDGDLHSLLNNMSQQQLMHFFGNVGQMGGLGNSLSNLLGPASSSSSSTSASRGTSAETTKTSDPVVAATAAAAATGQTQQSNVDLASSITVENLQAILTDPNIVRELQKHLPPISDVGTADSELEQVRATIQSPQFQQALSLFCSALQSGQLGPVVQQFSIGTEAVRAANQGDLERFVRALQSTDSTPEESDDKKPADQDEPME